MDSFTDKGVLELLLFYSIPRGDVNPTVHELMNRFGTLAGVMDAPEEELVQVPGIGESTARLLKLVPQIARRYLMSRASFNDAVNSSRKAGEYLMPFYCGEKDETVFVLCLDSKKKVLACRRVFTGSVNSTDISIRKLVEMALQHNATGVIISHNHPSGIAIPSAADRETTKQIAKALKAVDVELLDHIVVADDDFVSMLDSGLLERV